MYAITEQSGYIYGAIKGNRDAMFTAIPVHMRLRLERENNYRT